MMRSKTPKMKKKSNKNLSNSTSGNGNKKTYPKDYGAPKRPLSGFFYFLKERRESVCIENPKNTNNRGKKAHFNYLSLKTAVKSYLM